MLDNFLKDEVMSEGYRNVVLQTDADNVWTRKWELKWHLKSKSEESFEISWRDIEEWVFREFKTYTIFGKQKSQDKVLGQVAQHLVLI